MKKIGLLAMIMVMIMLPAAMSYDQDTPYTVTLQWIVPSDTTFSIALCGGESGIDFDENLTASTQAEIQPDCQDNGSSVPIATITNDGNIGINISLNLTAARPTWASLWASNESFFTEAVEISATVDDSPSINKNLSVGESTELYVWTNITNAPAGTAERTFQINAGTVAED